MDKVYVMMVLSAVQRYVPIIIIYSPIPHAREGCNRFFDECHRIKAGEAGCAMHLLLWIYEKKN